MVYGPVPFAPRRAGLGDQAHQPRRRRAPSRVAKSAVVAAAAFLVSAMSAASTVEDPHRRAGAAGPSPPPLIPSAEALDVGGKAVVVGLNAALQKRIVLPPSTALVPGSVHRADRVEMGVGGKGQDVAVALSCLWGRGGAGGGEGGVALAQFVGSGAEGDAVMGMLEDVLGPRGAGGAAGAEAAAGAAEGEGATVQATGWDSLTVRPASGLRTCTTVVGSDCATELVEPSGSIEPSEMAELLERVTPPPGAGGAAALCVMGSMPPGCPAETYADVYGRVADARTACLVDSVAGLGPLLGAMAAKRASFGRDRDQGAAEAAAAAANVLKLNAAELCRLAGVEKGSGGGEAERATNDDVDKAVRGFLAKFGDGAAALDYLAVTDGRHPARLVELTRAGEEDEPGFVVHGLDVVDLLEDDEMGGGGKGEALLYPIGAGDTVAAGTLAAMLHFQRGGGALGERARLALSECREAHSLRGRTAEVATSFAFGLACGSASCLKQENSVFDVDDALRLFAKATSSN